MTERIEKSTPSVKEVRRATCDQYARVLQAVQAAMRMALALHEAAKTGMEQTIAARGEHGIALATTEEILRHLGFDPFEAVYGPTVSERKREEAQL